MIFSYLRSRLWRDKSIGRLFVTLICLFWFGALMSQATTYYVATNGVGGDFLSWGNAASNIQDAISKATTANDIVLVSNGVYETGGVTNWPSGTALTNRVAITNAITVKSANNDPTNTVIKGAWHPVTTNGPAAVRCVYMMSSSSAKLIGFMLTNGATFGDWPVTNENHNGGGVWCQSSSPIISNCVIAGNAAHRYGGGVYSGTLYNCTMVSNSAYQGGGAYNYGGAGALYSCTLSRNTARGGGGGAVAYNGTLSNCTIIGNSALPSGNAGGVSESTLYNCTLIGNSAANGGAAYYCALFNCMIISNTATGYGGGTGYKYSYNCAFIGNSAANGGAAYGILNDGTLYNCLLTGNSASSDGGGVYGISGAYYTLYNCTVVSNSANRGGGVCNGRLYNSIVYFNIATTSGSNWYSSLSSTNSCTAPTTTVWVAGNITDNPMFADTNTANYRLAANSPCIDRGTNYSWMSDGGVRSKDLDGRTRIRYGTVDMGAYERINDGTVYKLW